MDLSFPPLVECCFVGVVDTTCALCVLRVLCQQSEPQAAKSATTNKDKKTGGGKEGVLMREKEKRSSEGQERHSKSETEATQKKQKTSKRCTDVRAQHRYKQEQQQVCNRQSQQHKQAKPTNKHRQHKQAKSKPKPKQPSEHAAVQLEVWGLGRGVRVRARVCLLRS